MASTANRILTTHVGSLVRPPQLVEFLHKIEDREPYDKAAFEACLKDSIDTVVRQQADAGIDIVSDGEFSKGRNWAFYVHDRLTGVAARPLTPEEAKDPMAAVGGGQDRVAFPEFYAEYDRLSGLNKRLGSRFVVNGELRYSDVQVKRDIANLKAAAAKVKVAGAFCWRRRARCRTPRTSTTPMSRASSARSPIACTRNTRPSSMPDSTCRSTTPSCPTCTKKWCRR